MALIRAHLCDGWRTWELREEVHKMEGFLFGRFGAGAGSKSSKEEIRCVAGLAFSVILVGGALRAAGGPDGSPEHCF